MTSLFLQFVGGIQCRIQWFLSILQRCLESYDLFQCGCDGGAQPKAIDPFGYHLVGCKIGANAIRLHEGFKGLKDINSCMTSHIQLR